MRASKRSRNIANVSEQRPIPDDVKVDIARIVRRFEFDMPGEGSCFWRARTGLLVLEECGIEAEMKAGGMLIRVGPHRQRDTMRYALHNNFGGYYNGWLVGHAWNQVGDEIVDFSVGDWDEDVEPVGPENGLGPVEWQIELPQFIWQPAKSLPRWKSSGVPNMGDIWYGPWGDRMPPPTTTLTEESGKLFEPYQGVIKDMVSACEIRERLENR
jgi:hypothetical protein